MADWRQIQARIRKAKTSSDPPAQLAELYQRTRDAMVAFELAQWHEKAGNAGEMVEWYTTAAQRFRRAQWRTKAEEALARLGAPIPETNQPPSGALASETAGTSALSSNVAGDRGETEGVPVAGYQESSDSEPEARHAANGQQPVATEGSLETGGPQESSEAAPASATAGGTAASSARHRRRGRRGGRKRRGRGDAGHQLAPSEARAQPMMQNRGAAETERPFLRQTEGGFEEQRASVEPGSEPSSQETPLYRSPGASWQGGAGSLGSSRSRAGDPGLSSRIAHLESQVRRLLACPMASLNDADTAPAGPGVLLLSDSDQVTHYYIEACQTLRIGIGNLVRGSRGSKGGAQLKPGLAENLGINESKVTKYIKDHCVVRWIQLDEGATELAHFAIAVLRPVVL